MMLDRMEGNAELKTSVHQMLASRRLTHSVLLVGEEGLGAGFAARCIAADYLYPAGGAPAEALLRGECCRAVGKAGKRDSGQIETGIVREAISVEGMGAGGRYLVSQVTAMRSEIFNTSLSAEGRAVLLYHVERMNEESANALLKVMEEPPEGVLFLLTADSLAGVLPTIRSRCVSFAIAPVSPADCARYCTAHGVDKKTAALYSELFDGHIGTVLTAARDKARTEQVDKASKAGTLTGEGALLASLSSRRTGKMTDIVATIQAEQDRIIRSDLNRALVVQGGPGTGKTAVALHRAAYLLYTHRRKLERSGVQLLSGGCGEEEITALTYDSRKAQTGSLFFCLRGARSNGEDFAPAAYAQGCRCFVSEGTLDVPEDADVVRVSDARQALAQISAAFF
ncbi:MAG: hypothetical protein EGQ68_00795, partial [Faecalibacterium sp.]|nr:hypothetical protein [Faecalibacterium sp.]